MKILIVDDDFGSRKLMEMILDDYEQVDGVGTGKDALKKYKNSLMEKSAYDVILLDIMLPDMIGYEVLDKIRKIEDEILEDDMEDVKVIMASALGDSETIKEAFSQNINGYITKPIRREVLEKQIEGLKKEISQKNR